MHLCSISTNQCFTTVSFRCSRCFVQSKRRNFTSPQPHSSIQDNRAKASPRLDSQFSQSVSLGEHLHRSVKIALHAALSDSSWLDGFPWVMLGWHPSPTKHLDTSPAELVFGQPLCVLGDYLSESAAPLFLSCGGVPFQLARVLVRHRCITGSHGLSCRQSWQLLILCL